MSAILIQSPNSKEPPVGSQRKGLPEKSDSGRRLQEERGDKELEIANTTKWDTSDLRRLFSRCISEIRKVEGRGKNAGLKVKVMNSTRRKLTGRGYIGWYEMTIKIGITVDLSEIEMRQDLARLFIHEFYHNLGYRSQDHRYYQNDWTKKWDVRFVEEYPIREAAPVVKPKRDIQMERYEHVLSKVREYDSKIKRYQNLLKKWKKKQKYYENALIAAGKLDRS